MAENDERDVAGRLFGGFNTKQDDDGVMGPRPAQQGADQLARSFEKLKEKIDKLAASIGKQQFSIPRAGNVTNGGQGPFSPYPNGGGAAFGGVFNQRAYPQIASPGVGTQSAYPNGGMHVFQNRNIQVPNPGGGHHQLLNQPSGANGGQFGPVAAPNNPVPNGGHGARVAAALGTAVAAAGAYANRNTGDNVTAEYVATRAAFNRNGGGSFRSARDRNIEQMYGVGKSNGGINAIGLNTSDVASGYQTLSQSSQFATNDPRFQAQNQTIGAAGITNPTAGAAGNTAAFASLGTSRTYYGLRGAGIQSIDAQGNPRDPRAVASDITRRSFKGRDLNSLSPEELQKALRPGAGGLALGYESAVKSGALTQEAADQQQEYLRGVQSAKSAGIGVDEFNQLGDKANKGDKAAKKRLEDAGVGTSGFEALRDKQAAGREVQGEVLPHFIEGLDKAAGLLEKFNKGLAGFLGTGPGNAAGGAFGTASGALGQLNGPAGAVSGLAGGLGIGSGGGGGGVLGLLGALGLAARAPGAIRGIAGLGGRLGIGAGAGAGGGGGVAGALRGAIGSPAGQAAAIYGGLEVAQNKLQDKFGHEDDGKSWHWQDAGKGFFQAGQGAVAGSRFGPAGAVAGTAIGSVRAIASYFGDKKGYSRKKDEEGDTGGPEESQAEGDKGKKGGGKKVFPAKGPITSTFRPAHRPNHNGIDVGAPMGSPIYAAADGQVVHAGAASGFGNAVAIKHGDGVVTLYGHMRTINVRNGQEVKAGQVIAAIGSEGKSTGPHLHFEVHPNGSTFGGAVDPMPWLGGAAVGTAQGPAESAQEGDKKDSATTSNGSGAPGTTGSQEEVAALASALSGSSGATTSTASGSKKEEEGSPDSSGVSMGPEGNAVGDQLTNAKIILGVAKKMGLPKEAGLIGLMTALAESGLKNVSGGDRDSVGLFQQRGNGAWGSLEQRMNPTASATMFFQALAKTSWQNKDPWLAAQGVQRSAFSSGSNYKAQMGRAQSILNQVGYAKGAWELAQDEIAQLHKGEMVLPEKTANKVRDAVSNGQLGGGDSGSVVYDIKVYVNGIMDSAKARQAGDTIYDQIQRRKRQDEMSGT